MPTLHRFSDRPGFYIRGISKGQPLALELTTEGEQYMTETLGLADGGKFTGDTLKWLYKKKWATPMTTPPPEVPIVTQIGPDPATLNDPNPIVSQGVVEIRLSAVDQVTLDQSAEEVVRTLAQSGSRVTGPIPLPVHIESYTVIRETGRKVYEIRFYERLLQVRVPRRATIEAMNQMALPREVEVKVQMRG
jgi:small subunit ribosomal protein S10